MKVISPTLFMDVEEITSFLENAGAGTFSVGTTGMLFKPTKIPIHSDDVMDYLINRRVERDAALLWMADVQNTQDRVFY